MLPPSFASEHANRLLWITSALALFIALVLRVVCALNDLWFDEVISIDLASQLNDWYGVFNQFHYDNNHYLNSLWVYAVGPGEEAILYRGPAIFAGIATLPAVAWAVRPYGRIAQGVAVVLIATSYLQVHYSSEARGYAFQILFCVLAFAFLNRFHQRGKLFYATGFGLCSSLALLSHLLTINFLMACGLWTFSFHSRRSFAISTQIGRVGACFIIPLLTSLWLYLVNIQHLEFGGGPKLDTLLVFFSAWSLLIGVAEPGTLRIATGVLAFTIVVLTLVLLRKMDAEKESILSQGNTESWKFFLVMLIVIPGVRILIPGSLLFTRYFLLPLTFGTILLAISAGHLYRSPQKRPLVVGLVALFVALNIGQTWRLAQYGRGSYKDVVKLISQTAYADNHPVKIASTNMILDEPLLSYFEEHLFTEQRLQIADPIPTNSHSADVRSADWIIVHKTMDCSARSRPPVAIRVIDNHRFQLRFRSQASFLSGFEWNCYQRMETSQFSNDQIQ